MPMFQRKPSHTYLGEVWRDPGNRFDKREEDHALYHDAESDAYFVVENIEYASGPDVSCHHTIRSVENYCDKGSKKRKKIDTLIADFRARNKTPSLPTAPTPAGENLKTERDTSIPGG